MEKFKLALCLSILCVPSVSLAQMGTSWGIGLEGSTKYLELERTKRLAYFESQLALGGWIDSGERTEYASMALGWATRRKEGVVMGYTLGPSLITRTGPLLGSLWQLYHSFNVGVVDRRGVCISIYWKHFSNAGLKRPNKGRNFIGLGVRY